MQGCGEACDNMVQHDCLTFEGQSGSGMWDESNQLIHAIVTGAVSLSNGSIINVGTQLNEFVYNTLAGWYSEDAAENLPLTPTPPSGTATHQPYRNAEAPAPAVMGGS